MPQTKFFVALALHAVERAIGSAEKLFNGRAIVGIDGDADADADWGLLAVALQLFADARSCLGGVCFAGFRKDQGKFVATIARRRIDRAAAVGQSGAEEFDRAAAGEVAEAVIDFLEVVKIKQQDGVVAAGTAVALHCGVEN